MNVSNMTLDYAKEQWENEHSWENTRSYLKTLMDYHEDDMISNATFLSELDDISIVMKHIYYL